MKNDTLEKMGQMRMWGMKRAFNSTLQAGSIHYTPDELISYLIDAEWDDRHNRKIDRLTKTARFRYKANVEEITYSENRNLDENLCKRLASCDFIKKAENVLITGSTGVGKSYIVSALGHQACNMGFRVMYFNTNRMFTQMKMAKADGSYLKFIANRRLVQIGLPEQYASISNPFPWMSEIMDLRKEKNFFETRVIEYQTGGALSW